jgi:hypothetical protein
LPEEWKDSIIVLQYEKGVKQIVVIIIIIIVKQIVVIIKPITFSDTKKILSNFLLSRFTPYVEIIIGHRQCGFRCNRSTTDHIFCIHQILEKNGNKTRQCISSL